MNAIGWLGLAFVASAPALKGPPPTSADIRGEWVVEKMTVGGRVVAQPTELRYIFETDGKWLVRHGDTTTPREYTVDIAAGPPSIDLGPAPRAASRLPMLGIYKVERDTLTMCYGMARANRPVKFESPEDSAVILVVLKRATPKK
jgi:uncharacterized protein (TIGR03067 family)